MSSQLKQTVKLNVENLEERRVPASITRPDANGIVTITCGDGTDKVVMSQDSSRVYCNNMSIDARTVKGVIINLGGGNDYCDLRGLKTIPTVVNAGWGDDSVFGGLATDKLFGEGGNDHLIGGGGYDYLYGGAGVNFLDDCNRDGHEYYGAGPGEDWVGDVVANNGTTASDIRQGQAGTCSFLSTLAGMCNAGKNLQSYIRYAGYDANTGTGVYDVYFWTGRQWTPVRVNFDGLRSQYDTNPSAAQDSWVVIMQRAYWKFHGNGGSGSVQDAMNALGIGTSLVRFPNVQDGDYWNIANALGRNKVVVIGTKDDVRQVTGQLQENHAYTVVAVSKGWVQVRNPWGTDGSRSGADNNPGDAHIWVRWSDLRASIDNLTISF